MKKGDCIPETTSGSKIRLAEARYPVFQCQAEPLHHFGKGKKEQGFKRDRRFGWEGNNMQCWPGMRCQKDVPGKAKNQIGAGKGTTRGTK